MQSFLLLHSLEQPAPTVMISLLGMKKTLEYLQLFHTGNTDNRNYFCVKHRGRLWGASPVKNSRWHMWDELSEVLANWIMSNPGNTRKGKTSRHWLLKPVRFISYLFGMWDVRWQLHLQQRPCFHAHVASEDVGSVHLNIIISWSQKPEKLQHDPGFWSFTGTQTQLLTLKKPGYWHDRVYWEMKCDNYMHVNTLKVCVTLF